MHSLRLITKSGVKRRDHTPRVLVLACALFGAIIYSSTVGFVHNHGYVPSNPGMDISAGFVKQAVALAIGPIGGRANENECLICVLHRQFSSSTVHTPLFFVGSSIEIAFVSAPGSFYYLGATTSRPIARMSGRAPPTVKA